MSDPLDYAALERGRDCNYWEYDRALQRTVERRCDAEGLEDILSSFGDLVGTTVTNNADVVEENPPELRTYDRNGELLSRCRRRRPGGRPLRLVGSRFASIRRSCPRPWEIPGGVCGLS
jgi:hypothetical protein